MTKWQIGWRYAVLLLTTVALWTYARVDGGNVASLLFYVMAGLTVYWTLFLVWPVTQALATREVSNKMLVAGTDIPVSLRVRRRFPFLGRSRRGDGGDSKRTQRRKTRYQPSAPCPLPEDRANRLHDSIDSSRSVPDSWLYR